MVCVCVSPAHPGLCLALRQAEGVGHQGGSHAPHVTLGSHLRTVQEGRTTTVSHFLSQLHNAHCNHVITVNPHVPHCRVRWTPPSAYAFTGLQCDVRCCVRGAGEVM